MDYEIIALILSVISLFYTWYTADKFGLKSKIYEKKLTVALELVQEVKSFSLNASIRTSDDTAFAGGIYISKNMSRFKMEYDLFKKTPVFFDSEEYSRIFKKLNEIKDSPFLDPEIVKSLSFLNTSYGYFDKSRELSDYAILTLKYNSHGNLFNPKEFSTFGSFIDNMQNILIVTEKWLNKKSELKNKLNI